MPQPKAIRSGGRWRFAALPEVWASLGVVAWFLLFRGGPLINDTAWHLWVSRSVNGGAVLYRDILEVNPPLWFWIGGAVDRAAEPLGMDGLAALLALFAASALLSVLLIGRLLPSRRERWAVHAALLLTLFLTSGFALGQREQFALIVTLPYIALCVRRAQGDPVPAWIAIAVGALAAPGFALKHYFLLVPLLLELWLLARTRRFRLRPELATLAAAGVAYVALMATITPAYFTVMVPLLRLAYDGFSGDPLLVKLEIAVLVLTWLAIRLRNGAVPLAAQAAAVAALGWLLAYLVQRKGFEYHLIPALGCGLAALFAAFADGDWRRAWTARVAASAALLAALAIPFTAGPPRYDQAAKLATASLEDGASIAVLSPAGSTAWPLVEERRFVWNSPHMTYWMLGAVWRDQRESGKSPELRALWRSVARQAVQSIACTRPEMILIDTRFGHLAGPGGLPGFFARNSELEAVLRGYRSAGAVDYLEVYQRVGGDAPQVECAPRAS
jgi:hypothetical protein